MKWETIPAEQFCDSVRDGTHDTPKPSEFGYKLVTGKHIKNGRIDSSDAYCISEDDYRKINERSLVEQWDVLMSMIGTVGETAVVKSRPDYAIKNVALFKCGGSELKGKWLHYYLMSPMAKGHMSGNQKGSSQQFLSLKQLRTLPVIVTDESCMQRIVSILYSYDDLIENNQGQIKLLEEAAQRLYKEWFIDLRFPGHETTPIHDCIPEGWEQKRLNEIADVVMGQSPKSEFYNSEQKGLPFHQGVGSYGNRFVIDDVYSTSFTRIAEAGSVLFSVRAPVGRLNITRNKVVIGRGLAAMNHKTGKLGVFWHTQGSGKSYSMLFMAQKIRRKFEGSPTIVILTDRDDLNKQISDTFENCGMLGKAKASQYIAASGSDLAAKLRGNPSFIFTLIQKFNQPDAEPIYPDHDIIVMSDEAHRSQNGVFADNMMKLIPTAARIGFTGTPLLSNDNITERTFGGYISIYDFKRAVEDGATVPLYYENRGDKIQDLHNPEITDRILDAIENADLDVNQQDRLEAEFAKEIHLLTAEPRLRSIARDFAGHYSDLWTSGKAMFVCLNKVTCVRMYNYVQEYWAKEIERIEQQIKTATQQEAQELERKLRWMRETEMAVVISQEQNEIQTFQKWGLDITPHRRKMEKRELDKEFKDSDNPFRVVFVCAMWLTGFDVKSLSCLYLDKPLKAHTLMQTIARANRVAEGKSNGLIVDYIGIVKALRKALADYTANKAGGNTDPTVDKEQLIARIHTVIEAADMFLAEHGFSLKALVEAKDFEKMSLLKDAADVLCETLEVKKTFQTFASELGRLMKYTDRDDVTEVTRAQKDAILAIYDQLQKKRKHADNVELMVQINSIISEYVQLQPQEEALTPSKQFDISRIDFDLLQREFAKAKRKRLVLKDLEDLVQERLQRLLFVNPDRINYYERYQEIIEAYNSEQDRATIEKTFMDLMDLANSLNQEEQRFVREGFSSDEELSLYDMLFREDLTKAEIKKIKEVSVSLLEKIKAKIAELDHWTDKQETKAMVDTLIRDILWAELPESYDSLSITEYRQRIYEYVFTRYKEVAA